MEKMNNSILPLLALDDIPNPNPDAKSIVALKKEKGKVVGYKLSNGDVVSKERGVELAKQGDIKGVAIASKYGKQYIKSIPDNKENNNLSNLPSI